MLSTISSKILRFIQYILVLLFIIFEELVWETFAKPIYEWVKELNILQQLQTKLVGVNRYIILILFVLLFVVEEIAGIFAGLLFVKGLILLGILVYMLRIPIVGFTFWLFHATESKLLSFEWFKWIYTLIVRFFDWVKSRDIYKKVIQIKASIKENIKIYKQRYLSGNGKIVSDLKKLYHILKSRFKEAQDQ